MYRNQAELFYSPIKVCTFHFHKKIFELEPYLFFSKYYDTFLNIKIIIIVIILSNIKLIFHYIILLLFLILIQIQPTFDVLNTQVYRTICLTRK